MPKVATKHTSNGAIKSVLKKLAKPSELENQDSVWAGPCSDSSNGGVTQSMLNFYLMDLERFRIRTIEGLREEPSFQHRLEYGNLWHICEECYAAGRDYEKELEKYVRHLVATYRNSQQEILKWYNIVLVAFPQYVKKWGKEKGQKPLLQEEVFHVPYKLPSGRSVWLRGKFDSVHVFPKYLELQENKTPGDPDVEQIKRMLQFELQTMTYVVALKEFIDKVGVEEDKPKSISKLPIRVKYNIARRPLSGGKHSIKQKKGQTETEFYKELGERIESDSSFFFIRFTSEISEHDIKRFQTTCLNPVLENLCDDYEWWDYTQRISTVKQHQGELLYHTGLRVNEFPNHQRRHFIMPFGLYHPIAEGKGTYLDEYILSGGKSMRGLVVDTELFPELKVVEV